VADVVVAVAAVGVADVAVATGDRDAPLELPQALTVTPRTNVPTTNQRELL
jgi:hypothetical protein